MRIRNNQIARKTEEIVKRYLFNGTYPKLKSITNELSIWMEKHTPGTPLFKSKKVFKKDLTSSEDFNEAMNNIETDITDAYDASIYQQNQLMKNFTQGEIMRERIRHDLDAINVELDKYIAMSKYADTKFVHENIVSFENANSVDMEQTTADLDLHNRQVTLKERNIQSKRIIVDSSKVTTSVLQSHSSIATVEPMRYAFDDSINTAWWCKVSTKETNSKNKMELEVVIPLGDLVEVNTLDFTPHHTKEMYVSLEYSKDNIIYSPISTVTNAKVLEPVKWSFKTTKMKYLKIRIKKNAYDEMQNAKAFIYYFGAKNIAIYKKSYEEESYLYTKVMDLPAKSKQLSVSASGTKRTGTDVNFAVCFNPMANDEDKLWHEVDDFNNKSNGKAKSIEINNIDTVSVSGRKVIETGEIFNGIRSYKILKNDGSSIFTPNNGGVTSFSEFLNAKLYRGVQQWRREQTYKPFIGDSPVNADWDTLYREKGNLISSDYFIKTNSLPFKQSQDNYYRFTTCIYSNTDRQIPMGVELTGISNKAIKKRLGSFSVYCNQSRLVSVNDEVTLKLTNGWNEIQVLVHLGDVAHRRDLEEDETPDSFLLGKMNIVAEAYVRADLFPMTLVDKQSLFYNISPLNHNYFAIDDQQVIINYLPQGTIFELMYDNKDLSDETIEYIVRARMTRSSDDESATPILNTIRIRTS